MAINTVKAVINSQTYNLTYNSTSGKWEATITAPTTTSYNINAGHYYPVQVTATNTAGTSVTKNDTDATLGSNLRLRVLEKTVPTITMQSPTSGSKLTTGKPIITFQLRDETNGSGIDITSLKLKIDSGNNILYNATGMTCTQVTNGYNVSYVCQDTLTDTSHTIYINISDNDGNAATQSVTTFSLDTTPPELVISQPTEGNVTNVSSLNVIGHTIDASSNPVVVTILLNNVDQGTVTLNSGDFSKSITLANGANVIKIRATDNSGLYTEIVRNITLDTSAPVIQAVTITPSTVDGGNTLVISVQVVG